MVTCQQIQENPEAYAQQQISITGSLQTSQVLPQGVWLLLTDGTGSVWVWSSVKLDGKYTVKGSVYETYLVLEDYAAIDEEQPLPQQAPEGQEEPQPPKRMPKEQRKPPEGEEPLPEQAPEGQEGQQFPAQAPEERMPVKESAFRIPAPMQAAQAPEMPRPFLDQARVKEDVLKQKSLMAQPEISPPPLPDEDGARLLKPLVVFTSSIAYGCGLYAITLSFPESAKSPIFYALPVLSLLLGLASWFALRHLNAVNRLLKIKINGARVEEMWKLYPPLIISAFISLQLSPNTPAVEVTPGFLASTRNLFLLSFSPMALSLAVQFINTKRYTQDVKSRVAISLISVAIIVLPLLVLYPVMTMTLR